jgi:hypothetical protein
VLSDIGNLAGRTPTKVGESYEWTSTVNSTEGNRANFCKDLDGKLLFIAIYCMCMNELKMSAQTGKSGVVNKTSVEPTAQDDFHEVKRRKRRSL